MLNKTKIKKAMRAGSKQSLLAKKRRQKLKRINKTQSWRAK